MGQLGRIVRQLVSTQMPKGFDFMLLVYRVIVSMAFLFIHGLKKITHFQEEIQHIPDPFGVGGYNATVLAIFSNVVCSIFVSLGLFTRAFALGAFAVPFIGLLVVHANDPWAVRDVPLMYSLAFLAIMVLGPGKYAVDSLLHKKIITRYGS